MSLVATMESFLPWKTTVQLRITTDYNNVYFRNVRFILGRTRVIEKAGHQVYSGTKMFWCWSPREEKYINFCWNIFLLANFRHWVILLQLFAIIINIIWPFYLAQLCGDSIQISLQILRSLSFYYIAKESSSKSLANIERYDVLLLCYTATLLQRKTWGFVFN